MPNAIALVNVLLGITQLLGTLGATVQQISSALQKARDENRDVTDQELQEAVSARKTAGAALDELLEGD